MFLFLFVVSLFLHCASFSNFSLLKLVLSQIVHALYYFLFQLPNFDVHRHVLFTINFPIFVHKLLNTYFITCFITGITTRCGEAGLWTTAIILLLFLLAHLEVFFVLSCIVEMAE